LRKPARYVVACDKAVVHQHSTVVLPYLVAVLRECPNFRSQVLAAAGLQRLSEAGAAVLGSGRPIAILPCLALPCLDCTRPSTVAGTRTRHWLPYNGDGICLLLLCGLLMVLLLLC
jgi:hypothetical protein